MIGESTATMSYAATQTLPSCTDPTGQNLPCMMVISTLPPPANALQCQETSRQILPCSYTTQNLSNGEQIVAITVYVPAIFVFSSPTVIKVVVHETTKTTIKILHGCPEGQILNHTSHKCVDIKPVGCSHDQHPVLVGKVYKCVPNPKCLPEQVYNVITGKCEHPNHGNNMTNTTTSTPPGNNMTVAASGGKGTGPSCTNNCTTGTPPPTVDCNTNPSDPSCSQQPPPQTQTCPDGSQPDSSGKCPTAQLPPPSQPSNPPSGSGSGNNNSPSGAGGSSGSGSSPPSPNTQP